MESYPPKPACFVKGWRYFDTLESLERPTTLLFWWLLSNHLPLLKADSPEGFFSSFKHQFSGGERFVSRRVWWFLGRWDRFVFVWGGCIGLIHVQHVLFVALFGDYELFVWAKVMNNSVFFFWMRWIWWWFAVWLKRLEGWILLKNHLFSYYGEGIVGNLSAILTLRRVIPEVSVKYIKPVYIVNGLFSFW